MSESLRFDSNATPARLCAAIDSNASNVALVAQLVDLAIAAGFTVVVNGSRPTEVILSAMGEGLNLRVWARDLDTSNERTWKVSAAEVMFGGLTIED
jgi:hypothetical protein